MIRGVWKNPYENTLSAIGLSATDAWIRVLMTMADPIRRVPPYGAWLWRLKQAAAPLLNFRLDVA